MLNWQNKTLTKIIAVILIQSFFFTGLVYPESVNNKDMAGIYRQEEKLRVPLANSKEGKGGFSSRFLGKAAPKEGFFRIPEIPGKRKEGPLLSSGGSYLRTLMWIALVSLTTVMCSSDKDRIDSSKVSRKDTLATEIQIRRTQRDYLSDIIPYFHKDFSPETKKLLNKILNNFADNQTTVGKSVVKFTSKSGKFKYKVDFSKEKFIGHNFFGWEYGAWGEIGWVRVEYKLDGRTVKPHLGHNGLWTIRLPNAYDDPMMEGIEELSLEEATAHELTHIVFEEAFKWQELIFDYLIGELGYGKEQVGAIQVALSEYITYQERLKIAYGNRLKYRSNPGFYKRLVRMSLRKIKASRAMIPDEVFKCLEYEPCEPYKKLFPEETITDLKLWKDNAPQRRTQGSMGLGKMRSLQDDL